MLKSVIEPYALPDTVYTQMVMKKIIGRKPGCRFFWGLPLPKGRCRYATGLAIRSALSGLPPLRSARPMPA